MKTNYLFPTRFKKLGWLIFCPAMLFTIIIKYSYLLFPDQTNPSIVSFVDLFNTTVFAIMGNNFDGENIYFKLIENNILNEIFLVLSIISLLFIGFSKEKHEDELIAKIRTESLVWATYVNYIILLLCILFIFNLDFLYVIEFNIFTILIFFIIRFNLKVAKLNKSLRHEE